MVNMHDSLTGRVMYFSPIYFHFFQARILSYQSQLTTEPPPDTTEPVSTVRMRLPTGEMITRRFLAATPIRMAIMFLGTKGYHAEDYKILTTFPKKDVSNVINVTRESVYTLSYLENDRDVTQRVER